MREVEPIFTVEIPDTLLEEHRKAVEDISYRFEQVNAMAERGGETCFPQTLAFTHPQLAERYRLDRPVHNLMLYRVAKEVAQLSGEKFERNYFGKGETWKKDKELQKSDLERFLQGASSVWFGTIDSQIWSEGEKEEGYNHILGIVPYTSPFSKDTYMVEDTSGQIGFEPRTIDKLYENILNLPLGKDYMQSVFAFRERTSRYKPKTKIDEYLFFTS